MVRVVVWIGLFIALFEIGAVESASARGFRHFQKKSRFPYEIKLFKMAMEAVGENVSLFEFDQDINYARGMALLEAEEIDFAFFASNNQLEKRFLAIKIPILNGILGYRLNLIHKDNKDIFLKYKDLEEVRLLLTAGFNEHWPDRAVLDHNKMKVVYTSDYRNLFKMLNVKRFDYFPRGINEIWTEWEANKSTAPDIIVEPNMAFYYPYPVYFFVNKKNLQLQKKLEQGLKILSKNGKLKEWFLKYHQPFIEKAKIKNRSVIYLKNPNLPSDFNESQFQPSWWR